MLTRFFLILTLVTFNTVDDVETIEWNESQKLLWNDFKGKAKTNTDAAAVTASGITFSYSVKKTDGQITSFKTQAYAHFYPKSSWYIASRCNDHILKHEQLHFDITELHVRIFRYRISLLEVSNNVKSQLNALHKEINKELADMQEAYDTQSQNSINKEAQAKWNTYVAENLKTFEAFKSE